MHPHGTFARLSSLRLVALALALALVSVFFAGASAHADASTGPGGLFVSQAGRLWDTSNGTGGAPTSTLTAGQWYSVGVDGVAGIPTSGVSAVQVNFVVSGATASGGLHADADGVATPNTSVSYVSYGTSSLANGGTIPVGADGKIQVEVSSSANLRIDVQGYYSAGSTAAGGYVPIDATTIASYSGVASQAVETFNVAGQASVPSNASSVMLSISESNSSTSSGYVIAYPAGTTRPPTALYWPAGDSFEWSSAVALPSSGQVSIYVGTGGPINLSVAVQGYFTPSNGTTAGQFTPGAARVYDSRSTPASPIAAGGTSTIQVSGVNGVPDIGDGIDSVAVNIAILSAASGGGTGHVQVYGDDQSPGANTQQFYAGSTTSEFAIVPLGADGGITVQNSSSGTINVVIDVEGWYQGIGAATISCPSPYTDTSWQTAVITSDVQCTVVAPPATTTNGTLQVSLNSDSLGTWPLSQTTSTTESVTVPAGPGLQQLGAFTTNDTTGPSTVMGYSFGSGDWSTAAWDPSDPDGSTDTTTPTLSVSPENDVFSQDAIMNYTISANTDGSSPVATSGWISDPYYEVPSGVLISGTTYYWNVEVQGTAGGRSTISDVTSPMYNFVANANYQFGSQPDEGGATTCTTSTTKITNVKSQPNVTWSPQSSNWQTQGTGPGDLTLSKSVTVANSKSISLTVGSTDPAGASVNAAVGYSTSWSATTSTSWTIYVPAHQTWMIQAEKIMGVKTFNFTVTRTCSNVSREWVQTLGSGTGHAYKFLRLGYRNVRLS